MTWAGKWEKWEPGAMVAAHLLLMLLAIIWAVVGVHLLAPPASEQGGLYVESVQHAVGSAQIARNNQQNDGDDDRKP